MADVVVTGAPGWLGTPLVEMLVQGASFRSIRTKPRRVRCLVHPSVDASAVQRFGDRVEVVRADLRDRRAVAESCDGAKTLFHCAGLIHPRRIQELYDVNVGGTQNLLDAAIQAGVQRMLFVSSNSPAGLNANPSALMVESDPPRPYLNYGLSKLQSEWLINDAFRAGKIQTTIVRPCWFYGPHQPLRQTRFFKMIQGGHPIVVGRGDNLRSMSYVDNIVQALLLAEKSEKAAGRTYWIADRRPYSFIEIIETVARVLGVHVQPRYLPRITSDVARLADSLLQMTGLYNQEIHVAGELAATIAVSIDAAVRDLGYDPEIELEEGMQRSIAWARAQGIAL
jgi:nucleoside-diphosphate-sugar epimerase